MFLISNSYILFVRSVPYLKKKVQYLLNYLRVMPPKNITLNIT